MFVVFDIGGTKTRIAVSENGTTLATPVITPTISDFRAAMHQFKEQVQQQTGGREVVALAGGVRALDRERGRLRPHAHYPLWVNEPLRDTLSELFHAPVYLENDAALAALGEATSGAGADKRIVAFLTVSTGVGGARVVDGRVDETAQGFEPGHQIVAVRDGEPVRLETLISGTAIAERYGMPAEELTDTAAWEEIAAYLALGINNAVVHWSPDIVVLGGGVTLSIPLDYVRKELERMLTVYPAVPSLVLAKHGEASTLYGALASLRNRLALP